MSAGGQGGPMAALFAATHPEHTLALVPYGIYVNGVWAPDYPGPGPTGGRAASVRTRRAEGSCSALLGSQENDGDLPRRLGLVLAVARVPPYEFGPQTITFVPLGDLPRIDRLVRPICTVA